MRFTRSSTALAVVGVLLLVAAALVRFVLVPSMSKLPSDFESSQDFEGTYTGLNPAALAGSATGDVLLQDVPVTATRSYATDSVEGDTAVVVRTIERSIGGHADPLTETRYAVDRVDFGSVDAPSGAEDVVASDGLIFTLPLDPETDGDYQLWDQTTAAAYPLEYEGSSELEGRTVYEYRSQADGEIADPAALDLPTSLPKATLAALAPALADLLPPELLAQLPAILPQLPDDIPISWTSATTSTVFADAELGAPLRAGSEQQLTAELNVGVPLQVPFSTITLTTTDESTQAQAADTADDASRLNLFGTILPIGLAILGLLFLVAAALLARRASPGGATPVRARDTGTPVGV